MLVIKLVPGGAADAYGDQNELSGWAQNPLVWSAGCHTLARLMRNPDLP